MKFIIDLPIKEDTIKQAYRLYFGGSEKITKGDLSVWISNLAQADIESLLPESDD